MKNMLAGLMIAASVMLGTGQPAMAGPLQGPHEVLIYNHRTYIAVPFYEDAESITYRFYRARGPRWQKWGAATVYKKQRKPDGSLRQSILFNGAISRISYVDLADKSNLFFGGRRG